MNQQSVNDAQLKLNQNINQEFTIKTLNQHNIHQLAYNTSVDLHTACRYKIYNHRIHPLLTQMAKSRK